MYFLIYLLFYQKRGQRMKKKIMALVTVTIMALQLVACSLEPTCKASGCDETNLYQDGYCKYHYYMNAGESMIKDIVN